jgi:tetratricopeptide (TPR) repeat protein
LPVSERSADTFLLLGLAHKAKADRLLQENREPEAEAAYQRARAVLERAVVIDRAANGDLRERRRAAGHPVAEIQDLGNGRLYDVLGNVCLRMADTDCALEQFAYLRRIDPDRSVSYMLSAWALTQKGRLEEAAVMTLEAWLLDARPDAVSVLVEIYRQLDPALDVVTSDGALKFDAPRVRAHLEQACRAHGERARAKCHELGIDKP